MEEETQGEDHEAFQQALILFAGVALVVATFTIYNTLSILVAQRTRESALLRALGASRGQVLGSVTAEVLAVGPAGLGGRPPQRLRREGLRHQPAQGADRGGARGAAGRQGRVIASRWYDRF